MKNQKDDKGQLQPIVLNQLKQKRDNLKHQLIFSNDELKDIQLQYDHVKRHNDHLKNLFRITDRKIALLQKTIIPPKTISKTPTTQTPKITAPKRILKLLKNFTKEGLENIIKQYQ